MHVPDGFNIGDMAEVFFDVESYQGTKKDGTTDWFTSVRGYKMQKIETQNNAPQGGTQAVANNPFHHKLQPQVQPQFLQRSRVGLTHLMHHLNLLWWRIKFLHLSF